MSTSGLLSDLSEAVRLAGNAAAFCCGGNVHVEPDGIKLVCLGGAKAETPLVVPVPCTTSGATASHAQHADQPGGGSNAVAQLSAADGTTGEDAAEPDLLQRLLARCSEASFGDGTQNVLDPTYRSALCLPSSEFATTFRLEEHDILSTIKRLMMPSANSVTAQLYKLNVYRPGDFFRPHVDTPRGNGMFGSLVVCLPQPHTGGALVVRHGPKGPAAPQSKRPRTQLEHIFDWGSGSQARLQVQWTAFYSDCEHEILSVESGHRLTLTYNLYADAMPPHAEVPPSYGIGSSGDGEGYGLSLRGLDASSLLLHTKLSAALASPEFLPNGGKLAFTCRHKYPHTHDGLCKDLDSMLKGGDAVIMAAARGLGLTAKVQAVYDLSPLSYGCERNGKNGNLKIASPARASVEDEDYDAETEHTSWRSFPGYSGAKVHWVTDTPSDWQLQTAGMHYGNEYTLQAWYTAAAIVVDVPPTDGKVRKQLCGCETMEAAAEDEAGTS